MKAVTLNPCYSDSSKALLTGEYAFPILLHNRYIIKTYDRIELHDKQVLLMEAGPEKTLAHFMEMIQKHSIAKREKFIKEPMWQLTVGLCK
jgi:hypothetical protein